MHGTKRNYDHNRVCEYYPILILILGNTQLQIVQTVNNLIISNKEIGLTVIETKTKLMIKLRNLDYITNLKV